MVTEVLITPLKNVRRKQELMPKVLQQTLEHVTEMKDTRLYKKLSNWDLMVLELLVLSSMWIAGLSAIMKLA